MFLLDSAKFATDPDGVSQQVIGILEKAGGSIDTHRPWQDGRLAYPIEGNRKGLHYLVYFRMDGQNLTDVTRSCKLNDLILRHMVIKHPQQLYDAMVDALNQGEATDQSEGQRPSESEKAKSDNNNDGDNDDGDSGDDDDNE